MSISQTLTAGSHTEGAIKAAKLENETEELHRALPAAPRSSPPCCVLHWLLQALLLRAGR